MTEPTKILYKQIQSRYIKVVWTHKINEKQCDLYNSEAIWVKKWINWLTVITTSGVLANLFPSDITFTINNKQLRLISFATAILSCILSYLVLKYQDRNIERKAEEVKLYAAKCHALRNEYESLMTDIVAGLLSDKDIIAQREILEKKETMLYSSPTPYTSHKAVVLARKALKIGKESTTEEEEIDQIVPSDLIIH